MERRVGAPVTRTPVAMTVGKVALSLFAAVALTALVASLAPGLFFSSTLVTVLLAVGLVAVFGVAAFFWMRTAPKLLIPIAVLLVLAIPATAYVSYDLWTYHEEPEFCADTCHVMEPAYESFEQPGANLVMHGHQQNGTAECLDCHTGPGVDGQVDLMASSARHIWKYAVTKDYDPDDLGGDDAVLTVPDENCLKCHADDLDAALPEKHDRYEEDCAMCHSPHQSDLSGYAFPEPILETEGCDKCHEERPLAIDEVTETGHTAIADEDCQDCHQDHGLKDSQNVLACTDAGCHDDDAQNEDSLVARDHFLFDLEECADCHNGAHNLTGPDIDALRDHCTDCHDGKPLSEGNVHLAVEGPMDGDCSSCHGAGPMMDNLEPRMSSHGVLECQGCHAEGNDLDAPVPSYEANGSVARDWMREDHRGTANWTGDGRGSHAPDTDCSECHSLHDYSDPVFPEAETCDSSCHSWLQDDVTAEGFTAVSGEPNVYEGTLDPLRLLTEVETAHTEVFEETGCTGLCHNEAKTVDIEGGLSASTQHGVVTKCTDCHRFETPASVPAGEDGHNFHAVLLNGEKPLNDSGDEFAEGCAFCHATNTPEADHGHDGPGGGCYNCHLSGHRPETVYWG